MIDDTGGTLLACGITIGAIIIVLLFEWALSKLADWIKL
jgi:hypothetical protein